ncbi:hypothetical protein AML91_08750 [Paenibacillus jilunlii]|uniref:Sensor histidine kinase NatK-like C-terminal domain-containing protein n=1 Tax=Paenibacillus jilunlii TaxID=682956 RepID=A0ABR5SXT2_9BACL|nr:hypothetical protein AML91_08750 [Paenibacillus jilunlii]
MFTGTTLLELILLNRYFTVLFHNPGRKLQIIILHYLLAGAILFTSSVSFFPMPVTGLLTMASTFLIARLYAVRPGSQLIFSALYLILGFIAESLSYCLILAIRPAHGVNQLSRLEQRLLILFISALIMLLFINFIRLIKRGQDYKISKSYYFIMTLIILISLLILNTLFFYSRINLWYILSVIGILGINFLIIFLFDRMIEIFRLAEVNYRLQRQMDAQDISYKQTVHSFMGIKRIIHDTNKQLVYIRACIEAGHALEGIEHINRILHQIEASCQKVTTGNLAIDALISNALSIAYDRRIAMEHKIHIIAAEINIDRYDLCIVLGNLLDNSIEAAQQVSGTENRFIQLHIHSNNNALVIYVGNSMADPPLSEPLSHKDNPGLHGIGLSNVQRTADKYGGHLKTTAKNGKFETVVVLPYPKISDSI